MSQLYFSSSSIYSLISSISIVILIAIVIALHTSSCLASSALHPLFQWIACKSEMGVIIFICFLYTAAFKCVTNDMYSLCNKELFQYPCYLLWISLLLFYLREISCFLFFVFFVCVCVCNSILRRGLQIRWNMHGSQQMCLSFWIHRKPLRER